MADRTLTISSAGKTFSFTGWKVGWATGPAPLVTAVRTAKQFLTYVNGAPFQPAVAVGLRLGDDYFDHLRDDLARKRDVLCDGLARAGLAPIRPDGTYFVTVDLTPGRRVRRPGVLPLPPRPLRRRRRPELGLLPRPRPRPEPRPLRLLQAGVGAGGGGDPPGHAVGLSRSGRAPDRRSHGHTAPTTPCARPPAFDPSDRRRAEGAVERLVSRAQELRNVRCLGHVPAALAGTGEPSPSDTAALADVAVAETTVPCWTEPVGTTSRPVHCAAVPRRRSVSGPVTREAWHGHVGSPPSAVVARHQAVTRA